MKYQTSEPYQSSDAYDPFLPRQAGKAFGQVFGPHEVRPTGEAVDSSAPFTFLPSSVRKVLSS